MAEADKPPGSSDTNSPPAQEPVWSYRGYNLRPSEFTTAMVHYYRAEIQRSNTWRTRLDNTTNWAVLTAGAAISFALSSPNNHFGVIILDTLLITLFLWIEARRYRYYELWSLRARLIETDFFAAMLVPPFGPHPEWGESLAESLLQPEFPISMWEAFGRRFRRNYMWIFVVLAIAWALKGFLHPVLATSWSEFITRSALGPVPGEAVLILGLLYKGVAARPKRHRGQLLALIVTARPQAIADRVLKEMRRGVTELHGRGMYTQQDREVLMVALTVTEMPQLKALVSAEDANAFVIVTPAQEVLGRGFQPLTTDGKATA